MSNYFYKGVNLNQIYVNDSTTGTISGYSGMPNSNGTQSSYSGMNPLSFGYNSGNIGLYNQVTANNTGIITSTNNSISVPSGSKSCNIICVGGGGGNGGEGGSGKATSSNSNNLSGTGNGGGGGSGGYAEYNYYNSVSLVNVSVIGVTIGNAGNDGTKGDDKSSNFVNGTEKGDSGNSGSGGNYSSVNNIINASISSNGGNGGGGGDGGSCSISDDGNSITTSPGDKGTAGVYESSQANNTNFPALSNYGNPGTQGAVQIIWLYN